MSSELLKPGTTMSDMIKVNAFVKKKKCKVNKKEGKRKRILAFITPSFTCVSRIHMQYSRGFKNEKGGVFALEGGKLYDLPKGYN
jgi:hypothetical protein